MKRKEIASLGAACLVVAGIFIFALFIHRTWPWKMLALGALLGSSVIMALSLKQGSLPSIIGCGKPDKRGYLFLIAGFLFGTGLAIYTRQHFGLSCLPVTLTTVALIAPLTGAMEELLFRGYIQGTLNSINKLFALLFAALAHTGYKLLIINSLGHPFEFDFLFLAQWTLLGGVAFGALRLLSMSIYPPLIAHALFDVILYGGWDQAPFWVWS